jgi:uncharacterized SAM-binding protein YcdF (DUF218 family)
VRSSKRLWIAGLCGIAVVAAAVAWGVMRLGQWLVVEDPLATAYAIVVLSGRMPERAMEAARLYQHDFAARV